MGDRAKAYTPPNLAFLFRLRHRRCEMQKEKKLESSIVVLQIRRHNSFLPPAIPKLRIRTSPLLGRAVSLEGATSLWISRSAMDVAIFWWD